MLFIRDNNKVRLHLLFLAGSIILWIFGKVSQTFYSNNPLDLHFHDTYLVISHSHIVLFVAAAFGMFAAVYYSFPFIFRRYLNQTLGLIHFCCTLFGVLMIFLPMDYSALAGKPRRYYDYTAWESFKQYADLNIFVSIVVILLFFAQLLFCFNVMMSVLVGKKVVI